MPSNGSVGKRELEFARDKIVIGGCLRSLIYAGLNELPVVFTSPSPPFRFDLFPGDDLSSLGLRVDPETTSREVWERLMFILGLAGLVVSPPGPNTLRIADNTLVLTAQPRQIKFNFRKLVIFDDKQIKGLPRITEEKEETNRVIDWVNVRSGCRHDFDRLEDDGSDFVREILFYPSDRSDNKNFKDLAAISYLTNEQLRDFDYSDTMAKFKIKDMMKQAGIRGARNGRDQKRPDKYKYYAIKVEPAEREVISRNVRHYEPDERFEFRYDSIVELIANASPPSGYLRKLCEAF